MLTKHCETPLCNDLFRTAYNQEKFCPACKRRRAEVLSLYRKIKKQIDFLKSSLTEEISTEYVDGILLLRVKGTSPNGGVSTLKLSLTEHTKMEASVILRNVLRAYKYISRNHEKFKDVITYEREK